MELYAVAIYDTDAACLNITKEMAHSHLVAARVALANYFIEDLHEYTSFTALQDDMADQGLDVSVVAFLDS